MTGFKVEKFFFDKAAVINAMDRKDRAALSKAGAFIRTRARSSMRRTKKSAPKGQPPRAHVGKLKEFLYFSYDPQTKSVVVGPAKFGDGTVPRIQEEGGIAQLPNGKRVRIDPHPYMGPALAAELPNLPGRWGGSIQT
jgi:hypothetical protein